MSIIAPKQFSSLVSRREWMVKSLILLMMISSLLANFKTYKVARRFRSISVSLLGFYYSAFYAWEKYSKWSKEQLRLPSTVAAVVANWKSQRYSNEKLKTRLGWKPRVPMKQAMETFLAQFGTNSEV